MFRFYESFKERASDQPLTQEELNIVSGKKILDPGEAKKYHTNLNMESESLRTALGKQAERAAVSAYVTFLCFFLNIYSFRALCRDLGIKPDSNSLLLNGWLHATSRLKKSTALNFVQCSRTLITQPRR